MSRKWINFFTDAGIPSSAAATYALIFSENRISENMLLDLDREVLKEMGIQTMGDVISILKHARFVYEKSARDSVLQSSSKDKTEKPAKKTLVSTVSVPENDPYFYSPATQLKKPSEEKKVPRKEGPVLPPNMKLPSKVSSTSSNHQISDAGSSDKNNKERTTLKRKIKTSVQKGVIVNEETEDSDTSSSSSSSSSLECVSKYRKVLPEPSSSSVTSKARPSTAKPFCFSGTKRTVSILDKEPEIIPKAGTTFTITMGGNPAKTPEPSKKSVFSRLDNKSSEGSERIASPADTDFPEFGEKKFPFEDDDLQPTVEIINDLYTPPVEPFMKCDTKIIQEPVAWVKPIIHTEGILASPAVKPKVGPKERLGITSPSVSSFCPQSNSNSFDQYTIVNSPYTQSTDGMKRNDEILLDDDDVFYTNGAQSESVQFSDILEKKVSIPSMDYEISEKPSVKNRITFNQPVYAGGVKLAGLKPSLTPRERINKSLVSSTGTKVGTNRALSVKNRMSLKQSVIDRVGVKSSALIRERITFNSAPSIKDRIGERPISLVRERISLTSAPSVRERISLKPVSSARERISLKPAASVRERINLKQAPSMREKISLKPATSVRERISLKSVTPVRQRINGKPLSSREIISLKSTTVRERITAKPAVSVRERVSLKSDAIVRERVGLSTSSREMSTPIRSMKSGGPSLKPVVANRIAHKGVPVRARYEDLSKLKNVPKNLGVISKTPSVFSRLG